MGIMVTVVLREDSIKDVVDTDMNWGLSNPKVAVDDAAE